ncbi:MAG: V-type ATP synthase subunit E [Spirochaetes bacterium]|nr:V-type ATP synthase subunit E [Spirochaetota bacterium]MBU0956331.1 V-type ATP synthase subunit E [Spirochaetota bacterium]
MDSRVQEILEKIKRDAVDEAKSRSAKMMAEAEEQRKQLLADAEKEAKAIVEKAAQDAKRSEAAGNAALQQAARDLIRAFRGEIEKMLAGIVQAEVGAAFDQDVLKKAVPAVLEAMAGKDSDDLAVLLPEAQLKALEAYFKTALAKQLAKGVELKPLSSSKAGFRIAEKDGAAYYDFSAEAVADMLGAYLNTHLAGLVAGAGK